MRETIQTITLTLALLALVACQPPGGGADGDATDSPSAGAQISEWMPRVLAIEGSCDAALYVQTGPLTSRVVIDAAAGHDHGGADAGATVAVETALGSYRCTYQRGHEATCQQARPVAVVPPERPEADPPAEPAAPAREDGAGDDTREGASSDHNDEGDAHEE